MSDAGPRLAWAVRRGLVAAVAALAIGGPAAPAAALEAAQSFSRGTTIVTLQATGGAQANVENFRDASDIAFVGFAPRLSYLPFDPFGSSWYQATLEPGVEGWFQNYLHPQHALAGGLKAVLRLHGLGFGPFVPYVEIAGGAGATGLDTPESRSTFTFVLEAGPGLSVLLSRDLAVTAGYRFQHFSNGNTSRPNRGYEGHSGVVGVSFFFR
jgi:hypothetical protein